MTTIEPQLTVDRFTTDCMSSVMVACVISCEFLRLSKWAWITNSSARHTREWTEYMAELLLEKCPWRKNDKVWCVCSFTCLPLRLESSGTPAAAAGSHSLGRQRSEQPWPQTDTPPSCSGWQSSGRPPLWLCCGTHLQGCRKAKHA